MTTFEDTFLDDLEDSDKEDAFGTQTSKQHDSGDVDDGSDDSLDDLIDDKKKDEGKEGYKKPKSVVDFEAEMFADMEDLVDIDLIESKNEPLMTGTPVEAVSDILNSQYLKKHIEFIDDIISGRDSSSTSEENKNETEKDKDKENGKEISIKTDDYSMINSCNNLAVEIDNNILKIDKFIKNIYSKKFPELEGMVTNPIEYGKCVKILANKTPEVRNTIYPCTKFYIHYPCTKRLSRFVCFYC